MYLEPRKPWGNRSLGCHLVAHDFPAMPRQQQAWHRLWQDEQLVPEQQTFHMTKPTRLIFDAGAVIGYPQPVGVRGQVVPSLLLPAKRQSVIIVKNSTAPIP